MKANVVASSATFAHGIVPATIPQNTHAPVESTGSLTTATVAVAA